MTFSPAISPVRSGPYTVPIQYLVVLEAARHALAQYATEADDNRRQRVQTVACKWMRTTARALRGEIDGYLAVNPSFALTTKGHALRSARDEANAILYHLKLHEYDAVIVSLHTCLSALAHSR